MTVLKLDIHVDDPVEAVLLFDRIQIWRSPDQLGTPTPFVEISAIDQTAAVLDGSNAVPWNLNGLALTIALNGAEAKVVTFSGTDPISLGTVKTQINAVFPNLASEVPTDTGRLRLTSTLFGTQSSITVSASAAATVLGLSTTKINGKGAYIFLSKNTEDYVFYDLDGLESYWYRTRFYSSITGVVGAFSESKEGALAEALPDASLAKCFLYLSDGTGQPIVNRRVVLVPNGQVQITNELSQIYSILPSVDRISLVTDEAGYTEIDLVRGMRFKIFIEGTMFQREFVVPATGTDINLMTLASTQPDPFSIVVAPPMPIRTS